MPYYSSIRIGGVKGMDLLNRTPGIDGIIVDNKCNLHYLDPLMKPL